MPGVSQTSNQKVAIVIGGSSGIGRATAVALAKEEKRAKVVIAAHVTFKLHGFVDDAVHIHSSNSLIFPFLAFLVTITVTGLSSSFEP